MKTVASLLTGALVALALSGCASAPPPAPATVESDAPFSSLYTLVLTDLRPKGVVADVGIGQDNSGRFDLALEKATIDGQAKVALAFEQKVEVLKKQFQESLGSNETAELNETFSRVTKVVTQKTLTGVQALSAPKQIKKDKQIQVGIIIGIDPKVVNASFLNELQGANNKLYERFRSTQAFEELKKEMEAYDAKK